MRQAGEVKKIDTVVTAKVCVGVFHANRSISSGKTIFISLNRFVFT